MIELCFYYILKLKVEENLGIVHLGVWGNMMKVEAGHKRQGKLNLRVEVIRMMRLTLFLVPLVRQICEI